MGKRLSRIVTRTGDDGTTGLGDGSRTRKDALRVVAMGEVDELNSAIGLLLTEPMPDEVRRDLVEIQHDLFDLGGELSIPGHHLLRVERLAAIDQRLDDYNARLPALAEFILPGGVRGAAHSHLARTICRRAERALVALGAAEAVADLPRQFLNRLSDLLFVLARTLNHAAGEEDRLWERGREQKPEAGT